MNAFSRRAYFRVGLKRRDDLVEALNLLPVAFRIVQINRRIRIVLSQNEP